MSQISVLRSLTISAMVSLSFGIWDSLPPAPETKVTWKDKNFGQWCRNFSTGVHRQCPQGSFIHWYNCCGQSGTDCCFGIQTWFYVVFGWVVIVTILCFVWALLLHFDYVYPRSEKKRAASMKSVTKKLENGSEYNNVVLKT